MTGQPRPAFPVAFAFAALLLTASPADAQWVDANGETPKAVARDSQRSAYGGQKEDLRLSVEDVTWIREPCDDRRDCQVVRGVEFTLWVEWLNYPGPWLFGTTDLDSREPAEDQDGPDALVVHWEPGWIYQSATGDPSRVGSTSVAWTNATNCPESPPLTDRQHVAQFSDDSGQGSFGTFGFSRRIELELLDPQADSCRVPSLQLRAEYLHTYDDDLHVSWGGSVAIGMSVDASGNLSFSVGTTVNFTNDHAWNAAERFSFDPPQGSVRRCECCPRPAPARQYDREGEEEDEEGPGDQETPSEGAMVPTWPGGRLVLPDSVPAEGQGFGTALDASGEGVLTGLVIAVDDQQTTSDDDGRFWIPGDLDPGRSIQVRALPEGDLGGPGTWVGDEVPVVPSPEVVGGPPRLDRVPPYAGWQDFTVEGSGLSCDPDQRIAAYFDTTEAPILACDGHSAWTIQPQAAAGGELPPGWRDFYVAVDGKASNVLPVQVIQLHSRLEPPTLTIGEGGWAVYEILGTSEPLPLEVINHSPEVIRLPAGSPQRVTTSGGEPNEMRVRFQSLAVGRFEIEVRHP